MNRRDMLCSALAGSAIVLAGNPLGAAEGAFEVTRSDAEWRAMLTPIEYKVMRQEGTERSGSSPLDKNYAEGTFALQSGDVDTAIQALSKAVELKPDWPSAVFVDAQVRQRHGLAVVLAVAAECCWHQARSQAAFSPYRGALPPLR